uniref:G-protein coupled receptors family 1 profile domain-containing protein n=1 Tax=Biomphalaria glabrata TaxID=6526 RepID=A0A2C9LCY8_BIOGL
MTTNASEYSDCLNEYITDQILDIAVFVNFFFLNGVIGLLGLVVNIIKMIVFLKLGLRNSTNITFFVLSAADTGVVVMMLTFSLVFSPMVLKEINFDVALSIGYNCLGFPFGLFSRVASLITASITVERFLCVTFPLKVKLILKPIVAVVESVTIICVVVAISIPAFISNSQSQVFIENIDQIILKRKEADLRALLESTSFLSLAIIQLIAIGVITIFNVALTRKFLQITKWRHQVSSKTGKEKRLVKMVICLSVSFLFLSIPLLIFLFLVVLKQGFSIGGRCNKLYTIICSAIFPTDGLNSLVSFFLFLHMSSKFKSMTRLICQVTCNKGQRSQAAVREVKT